MLAREEMGKARILLDFWRDMLNQGRTVSVDDLRRMLDDHEGKQREAAIGQTLRAEGGTQAAQLLHSYHHASDPAERQAKLQKLEELMRRQQKRTPADRHKARMRALYVDLNESGSGWSRPIEMTDDAARAHLEDAANDYAMQWDRYQGSLEILAHVEP
jgi:AbiV family abortive infection protein